LDRHRVVAMAATAMLAAVLAGCGGSAAPSASASAAPTQAPVPTSSASEAPSSAAPASPSPSIAAAGTTASAVCPGVAMRKVPKSNGSVIARAKAGTKVHVVAVVKGDAYQAGTCGMAGDSWLKVDKFNGKSVKSQYGVSFGYVAAGFFQ
jgi:hypothetical protein